MAPDPPDGRVYTRWLFDNMEKSFRRVGWVGIESSIKAMEAMEASEM